MPMSIEQQIKLQELQRKISIMQKSVNPVLPLTDDKMLSARNMYLSTLKESVEIIGHQNLSDNAIQSLVEGASYVTWRAIMGPAAEPPTVRRKVI